MILSTVKKYHIFFTSDEYALYFFHCSKQRQFRQFRTKFLPEKIWNASYLSDTMLRMYARQIKQTTSHFDVTFELRYR